MQKLDFIFFDAGGGHRAAANALRQVMEQQGRPFEIRMVNLQELLDGIDVFRKLTGLRLQDLYNLMLKKGWTLGSPQLTAGMHLVIRLFHAPAGAAAGGFLEQNRPDMVVSLVPNFNRALCESLRARCRACRSSPSSPTSPIIRRTSGSREQDQHFICGSDKAVEQARGLGHPAARCTAFRA